VSALES
jgi:hypothetical protein